MLKSRGLAGKGWKGVHRLCLIGERHSVKEKTLWHHLSQKPEKYTAIVDIKPTDFITEVIKSSFLDYPKLNEYVTQFNRKVIHDIGEKSPVEWEGVELSLHHAGEDIHAFTYFNLSLLLMGKANACVTITEVVNCLYGSATTAQIASFEQRMLASVEVLDLYQQEVMKETEVLSIAQLLHPNDQIVTAVLTNYQAAIVQEIQRLYTDDLLEISAFYKADVTQMNEVYQSHAIMYRDLLMYDRMRKKLPAHSAIGYGHARNIVKIHELSTKKNRAAFELSYVEL